MKKVTSHDVARKAGVSQSAVSLILNGSDKVAFNQETRERVMAVAKELGYQLPKRRKSAASGGLLLLFTPTLNNPFYTELVQTVETYADSCGYRVIVCNTLRKPDLERYYLETFLKSQLDGIIYTFLPNFPELIEGIPTALIGEKRADSLSLCSIELSNVRAGAILADHLYSLGHRELAFVSTPFNQFTLARQQRLDGMRQYFAQHKLPEDCLQILLPDAMPESDTLLEPVPYEYAVGRRLIAEALHKGLKATALIGVNDMTAIGVMDELHAHGLSVPGDYSVCGFDNVFSASISNPPLTTIDHHLKVRCIAAVDMVLTQRQSREQASGEPLINKVEYSPRLIVRSSTGPRRERAKAPKA